MIKTAMEHCIIDYPRRAFHPGLRRIITLMTAEQHRPPQEALPRTRKS